jgi:hypothetical protein
MDLAQMPVFSLVGQVEVVEPQELQEAVVSRARDILAGLVPVNEMQTGAGWVQRSNSEAGVH